MKSRLMINHTKPAVASIDSTLKFLQLNTHRSWVVTHSLLNDPQTSSFHFLLIQEPYISPLTNLPVAHANWTIIMPDHPACPPEASPEDRITKSVIYASRKIPTTTLSVFKTNSNCIAAALLTLDAHLITIVSAYAPPKQAHKLQGLQPLLATPPSPTTHFLVAMDCNLHHALWNTPSYTHTHREAEDLILIMSEAGLDLRSECGIPTFHPSNPKHVSTTVDLLWLSSDCHSWTTRCQTDTAHEHSHLSDHAAIITELSLPAPIPTANRSYRKWKWFDPDTFQALLL